MRKDPPVDVRYLHATWILDHARGKTLLVNDPRGLRELNEHLAVLRFPTSRRRRSSPARPSGCASSRREQGGAIVVKPVDGYGGLGIFVVRDGDPNASSILETSTGAGTRWTLAQKYLPEAVAGRQADHPRRRRAGRRGAARARRAPRRAATSTSAAAR